MNMHSQPNPPQAVLQHLVDESVQQTAPSACNAILLPRLSRWRVEVPEYSYGTAVRRMLDAHP